MTWIKIHKSVVSVTRDIIGVGNGLSAVGFLAII